MLFHSLYGVKNKKSTRESIIQGYYGGPLLLDARWTKMVLLQTLNICPGGKNAAELVDSLVGYSHDLAYKK